MADLKSLSDKLTDFAEKRNAFKEAEAVAKELERPYRDAMNECIDLLLEAGFNSLKVIGVGTFTLGGRTYARVTDMPTLLEYAAEHNLGQMHIDEDGTYVIRFERGDKEAVVEGAHTKISTLNNGIFGLDVNKSTLNQLAEENEGNVPGIVQFTTRYITVYK